MKFLPFREVFLRLLIVNQEKKTCKEDGMSDIMVGINEKKGDWQSDVSSAFFLA
jgi:hypothetical protein